MENLKRMCVGQYIFRKATVEDMTHIAALSIKNELGNAEFDDEEYIFLMKILPNEFSDLLNPESFQKCSFFVVIHENKIVGSAGLVPDHDNGWELTAVAINKGRVISEVVFTLVPSSKMFFFNILTSLNCSLLEKLNFCHL